MNSHVLACLRLIMNMMHGVMHHVLAQCTTECAKSNSVAVVATNIKIKPVGTLRLITPTLKCT